MFFFYLIAFSLLFVGIKVSKRGTFHAEFTSKGQCNAIKGLFILMVFISHSMVEIRDCGYGFDGIADSFGLRIRNEFMQLIVVMFLFYSGFGVMESITLKKEEYLSLFPRRRLLTVLLNFDIAVVLYLILDLVLGIAVDGKQVFLSLFAWESLGNSNWYIFVILFCYLVTFIGFVMFKKNAQLALGFVAFMVFAGMVGLSYCKPFWWYDTMLCYPFGMLLSMHQERLVAIFKKNYWPILISCVAVFMVLHMANLPGLHGLTYNVKSMVFAFAIVLLTMKVKIGNWFLYWAGVSLFPLFIYQRIPMIAIRELAGEIWICNNPYLFVSLCFGITVAITISYKYWQVKFK